MKMSSGLRFADGWRLVGNFPCPEVLVFQGLAVDSEIGTWSYLDPAGLSAVEFGLRPKSASCVAVPPSSCEVLFGGEGALFSLALDTKMTRELVAFDAAREVVSSISVSPSNSLIIVVSRMERPEPESFSGSPSRAPLRSSGAAVYEWNRGEKPHLVEEFKGILQSVNVDWKQSVLYAYVGEFRFLRFDLRSGEKSFWTMKDFSGLTLRPNGKLVAWSLTEPSIWEVDNAMRKIVGFGWYPAFSGNGQMAFSSNSTEFWLSNLDESLVPVLTGNGPDDGAASIPCWCQCGSHLALDLVIQGQRLTVLADVESKVVRIMSTATGSTRVWLPRERVGLGKSVDVGEPRS